MTEHTCNAAEIDPAERPPRSEPELSAVVIPLLEGVL